MPDQITRNPAVSELPAVSSDNPWTTLDGEIRYENQWIRVTEHKVINPSGNPGIYGVVHFKTIAIGVLPIDQDGCIHLVGQYRYSIDEFSWEMPEGGGAPDASPLDSARRELREETGLVARRWTELLRIHTSNSVCDEHGVVYLAWDMTQTQAEPEDTEALTVVRMPFAKVVDLVLSGGITDSMTVAAVLKVKVLLDSGGLPEELIRLISPDPV